MSRLIPPKWRVVAFNNLGEITGDAVNITAKISIDFGTPQALTDINPEEVEDGYYVFDLTETERTCTYEISIFPDSTTTGVIVLGDPPSKRPYIPTTPESVPFPEEGTVTEFSQTYGPKRVKTPNMEVEQFDPITMSRAKERESVTNPSLADFGITIASPNTSKYRRRP